MSNPDELLYDLAWFSSQREDAMRWRMRRIYVAVRSPGIDRGGIVQPLPQAEKMTDAGAAAHKSGFHAVRRAGLAALAVVLVAAIGAIAVRSHGSAAPAQRASTAPT